VAGKTVALLAVLAASHSFDALQSFGKGWDSNYYETIAAQGYGPNPALYAFSPVYPLMIRLLLPAVGTPWVSAMLVTNLLSFVFPILACRAFGYRTALFAELFPTYVVFTTVAYSDVVALVLIASSLLLLMRGKLVRSSLALAGAIAAFYSLAWTLPSFIVALSRGTRRWTLLYYLAPVVAGAAVLFWINAETGTYSLLALEAPWQVGFATPLGQVAYLLCPTGQGSFTCQDWKFFVFPMPPSYWVLRNLLFVAFYMVGTVYLLKSDAELRRFLAVYCFSVAVPLLFLVGTPALSLPRLLLPAFPAFLGIQGILKGQRWTSTYLVICLALTALISITQYSSFFS
jgi:hypothetical protein